MMDKSRVPEIFIFDIFIAIQKIKKVASKFDNEEELVRSFTDWDSIIREFEIIGEASKHLLNSGVLGKEYQIIVDFRNQLIHKYFGIDPQSVWQVIHKDLEEYEDKIKELIRNINEELREELIDAFKEDNKHLEFVISALERLRGR